MSALVLVGEGGVWALARQSVADVLAAVGRHGSPATVDVRLRWLVTCLGSPPPEAVARRSAELLADALSLTRVRT